MILLRLGLWVLVATAPASLGGDTDNDGVADIVDNGPFDANADQLDTDADLVGDVCDDDDDGDGLPDDLDNCARAANPDPR